MRGKYPEERTKDDDPEGSSEEESEWSRRYVLQEGDYHDELRDLVKTNWNVLTDLLYFPTWPNDCDVRTDVGFRAALMRERMNHHACCPTARRSSFGGPTAGDESSLSCAFDHGTAMFRLSDAPGIVHHDDGFA